MYGRHVCNKSKSDSTYSPKWSGVSNTGHCSRHCTCPKCGERLHNEEGNHYCPRCDDYVRPSGQYHEATTGE
jgi:hypothetical protein